MSSESPSPIDSAPPVGGEPSAETPALPDAEPKMDGRQTESWGDVTVSWSYHPDRGLDGVITVGATN